MHADIELDPETARLIRLTAAAGHRIPPGAPLAKFRHYTGSLILTRDAAAYRKLPGWVELPFDVSSPVPPRMP